MAAADAGSIYDPPPTLVYRWDPEIRPPVGMSSEQSRGPSVDLGYHPADPLATHIPGDPQSPLGIQGPNAQKKEVAGQDIWFYHGNGGYDITVKLLCYMC